MSILDQFPQEIRGCIRNWRLTMLDQIRDLCPIEKIAGEYTDLKPSGTKLVGICPLPGHTETAPSFTVYPKSQSFYCYGCQHGGDVFNFVMLKKGISFIEAVHLLAKEASIIFELSEEELAATKAKREVEDALTLATTYYNQLLLADSPLGKWSRTYLQKRGITPDSMEALRLGVSSGSGLLDFLQQHGVSVELAKKAGLVRERDGKQREFFYGRIIFPCLSNGRTTWLTGRALRSSWQPKYLGLPMPKSLYASTLRAQPQTDLEYPILVEGPIDAIALWQWGYSAVAVLGTTANKEWLPFLNIFNILYLSLDKDDQGVKGALRLAEDLCPQAKLVLLPEGIKDPGQYALKHTREEFASLLEQSEDFIEYGIKQIDSKIDRMKLPDKLAPLLDILAKLDPAKSDAYLRLRVLPHFNLTKAELTPFRFSVNLRRKEIHALPPVPAVVEEVDKGEEGEKVAALREKANILLYDPALLYKIGHTIKRLGVAGEDANIRIIYLGILSQITAEPISITLKGESSSGKSYVVGKVVTLFPPESYIPMTGMSKQALVYRDEPFAHKTIVIYERPGMNAADYNIRTLQSEGRIIFETVERDPSDDSHHTERVEKEGPTNFIITTTSPELNPENETRHWTLTTDETAETTLAAKKVSAGKYMDNPGVSKEEIDVWRQLQLALQPASVSIPYALFLANNTPDKPLRIRRDFNRLLVMIEVIALLYQKQRDISESGVITAELSDFFMARELIEEVFPASISGINKKVELLVSMVEELYREKLENGETEPEVRPKEIALRLAISSPTVSRWLKPAINADLVEVVSEAFRGRVISVKPGLGKRMISDVLPTMEALARDFPESAQGCKMVHPITGEEMELSGRDGVENASAVEEEDKAYV